MNNDVYMQRCLQLAASGSNSARPNPMVGCVIVHNEVIIGEGWHYKPGEPHAEVNAIASVEDKGLLKESTVYVSLEPCAHFGRTPPCADLLIKHKVKQVVIACKDDFAKVNGAGISRLQEAGIEVIVGVLKKDAKDLNKPFFTFHKEKRPFIRLKWAQTLDGFFDKTRDEQNTGINWITGIESSYFTHTLRAKSAAILVGSNTITKDNPELTTRNIVAQSPLRMVLDRTSKTAANAKVFMGAEPTIRFSFSKRESGKNVMEETIEPTEKPLKSILNYCYNQNIQSLMVEGGATLLQHFIDSNVWDEAYMLIGNKRFGEGLKAPEIKGVYSQQKLGEDTLLFFRNT